MSIEESLQRAKQMLAEAADRPLAEVPDNAAIGNWDGWDSLSHMRLVLALEEQLNIELSPEELVELDSLEQVAELVALQ